ISHPVRRALNLSEVNGTLRQFKERFDKGEIFKSATEICDIYLVPEGQAWTTDTQADAAWYGSDFALVGDNVRERPYANIYPRLTTKSNSFTVFYTVQALKNPSTDPAQWSEDRGVILGQYRGSTGIERYLDPNNTSLPDYATDFSADPIESYYRWRIISNRRFAP
ncbi:MAG: Verru/Chthon cassette protein A, partial [Chthoniobacterales bacterium]